MLACFWGGEPPVLAATVDVRTQEATTLVREFEFKLSCLFLGGGAAGPRHSPAYSVALAHLLTQYHPAIPLLSHRSLPSHLLQCYPLRLPSYQKSLSFAFPALCALFPCLSLSLSLSLSLLLHTGGLRQPHRGPQGFPSLPCGSSRRPCLRLHKPPSAGGNRRFGSTGACGRPVKRRRRSGRYPGTRERVRIRYC